MGSAALCVDGLTAISAFEFVAEKIHDLHTAFAVMVFLYFGAYFFKNVGRNDLWEHVLYDLSVKMIDARVLFVFQYIINGAADERFSLIGNAAPVEFAKIVALQARKTAYKRIESRARTSPYSALLSFILVF